LDEDLRPAIDRLIKDGGQLTVHDAADATAVVLEQPGIRFGILEVVGRVTLARDDGVADALLSKGWTDPTVTHRLGREIRLGGGDPGGTGPITLTRTWRVPPSLASEIADAVRTALGLVGVVGVVEFQPLVARNAPLDRDQAIRPATEERDLEHPEIPRTVARTVPMPIKAVVAIALMAAVGFVWAGMIRGAPRLPTSPSAPSPTSGAAGASVAPSPTPIQASPTSPPSAPAEIRPGAAKASTADDSAPASAAIDGEPATAWHAAFGVPQWIEISLDAPATVREVVLLIAQGEKGPSRHMIQVAVIDQALQVVGVVERTTADGDAIVFRPETPIANVERIRIETMASPSNAGWYEVIVR
jgi:hypothetical protein